MGNENRVTRNRRCLTRICSRPVNQFHVVIVATWTRKENIMPVVYKNGRPAGNIGEGVCRNGIAQTGTLHGFIPDDDSTIHVMRNNGEVQKWPTNETLAIEDLNKPEAPVATTTETPFVPKVVTPETATAPVATT